ncbi:sugar phosphate nucleotidyltransferase [Paenibacillus polymyxa]|uniref:sugar phosphate nucleotidyltransferase n=1 Tax=Paenibacillus TaxID=44249 RepID=UPI0008B8902C|nr:MULTISPECIES: sugar phosphate nucleotidyltransferase [Paenibacillus]KAF6656779.1 NTP transferase domain-containing protein [Paenibacillus sp. EKM301P]RPD96905.1 spore coat protein [Paenibacillus polymyxa]UBS86802.1 NTP transferase domain-containing protein [Paenibacillus polymyxa]WHX35380.1 sugar phosphate nucleotidyltransferase [Paenibacillus polymyxa]SEJ21490.1 glucose-1-phosphate thymidylyltransferase [Paenibacillus polymyxa]
MKGIILAGGTGSRLYPLTKVTNKHLLPIGKYPMIYYSIDKLKKANINDILIVTGKEHMGDVVNLLGSGVDLGVTLTYKVQDEAGGIAQALLLAEHFVGNDKMVVILGDNVFKDDISSFVENFKLQESGAKLLLHKVPDANRYGVPELQGDNIVNIEEKPKNPKSDYAVTGIYMFNHSVFDIIKTLTPSARGEYEITDVNNAYIQQNQLTFDILENWWTDAGTHASLMLANKLVSEMDYELFS